jgi:hypothetical protein
MGSLNWTAAAVLAVVVANCSSYVLAGEAAKPLEKKIAKPIPKKAPKPPETLAAKPVEDALPTTIVVGQHLLLPGLDVALNKIVRPTEDGSIGGTGFTEYKFSFSNTTADKELRVTDIGLVFDGETRRKTQNPEADVVHQNMAEDHMKLSAGASVSGLAMGFLGPIGLIAGMLASDAAINKVAMADPEKWRNEIKKQSFPAGEIPLFPGEDRKGSAFFKQSVNERATMLQLYVKQGGEARMYRLNIEGQVPATAAATVSKSD